MLAWGVLSLLYTISLLIIGMRRWEGWMFATLTNVGWIIYSAVYANLALLIISIVGLVVTFIFWLRWSREQKAKDANQLNEMGPASVH
jgi:hypothetical protein